MRSLISHSKNRTTIQSSKRKAIAYTALLSFSTMSVAAYDAIEAGNSYAVTVHTVVEKNNPVLLGTTHSTAISTTHPNIAHKLIGAYQNIISKTATAVSNVLRPIGSTIFNFGAQFAKIGSAISATISSVGSHITHVLGPVATKISSSLSNGIKTVSSAIGTGISTLGSTFTTAADFLGLTLTGSWNPPAEILPSAEVLAHANGKVPVVLIHGAFSNATAMINYYNALEKAGIPAYALTVGNAPSILHTLFPMMGESASVDTSAKEVADFVDKVQAETKSPKVDLVGYSEGGLITRDYLTHDTKNNVQAAVTLGGIDHGTTADGLTYILHALPQGAQNIINGVLNKIIGPSGSQILAGSTFQQNLSTYPETKAGIHYLDIGSRNDLVATPYQTVFLKPVPGADVTNIEVHSIPGVAQDFNHLTYPSDPVLIKKVVQYIETQGEPAPANTLTAHAGTATAPAAPVVDLLH